MPAFHRPPLRVLVWTAGTVALVLVAALLWRGSDAAATDSSTASPAGVPSGTPAAAVSEAWSAAGNPVPENPVQENRVIVGSAHGVRGLDVLTGEVAWSYTRSNARLCGLTATDGVAVAVFATADRCDEAVALDAGTGVRAWTRNVSLAGDAVLDSTTAIVLASNPGGVVTLDPVNDNIRWRHAAPAGCRLLGSDTGSAGVAVLQRCGRDGPVQLQLLDGFAGSVHWEHDLPAGDDVELLGVDGVVTVRTGDEVQTLSGPDGAVLATHPLPGGGADVDQATVGTVSLLRVDGQVTAFDVASGARLWEVGATGLPVSTVTAEPGATLLFADGDGVVSRDPATGAETGRFATEEIAKGGSVSVLGPVVLLRTDDEVRAYS